MGEYFLQDHTYMRLGIAIVNN